MRGPLHGVPLAHKDMYYREGVPSSCGSKIKGNEPEKTTATALKRLDAAGAIQFGVLDMAEFAYGPTGHNWHFGHVRNPWNPAHITGGSSSGSRRRSRRARASPRSAPTPAASIRLPAALCGITGLKVTYGRISRAGAMPLSFSMDTVGPLRARPPTARRSLRRWRARSGRSDRVRRCGARLPRAARSAG